MIRQTFPPPNIPTIYTVLQYLWENNSYDYDKAMIICQNINIPYLNFQELIIQREGEYLTSIVWPNTLCSDDTITCNHLRCWMLWLATWKQGCLFYAGYCFYWYEHLSINCNTSKDSRVCLSMIQPSLQAHLCSGHTLVAHCLPTEECHETQVFLSHL